MGMPQPTCEKGRPQWSPSSESRALRRITSYNVCYTKLLRLITTALGLLVAIPAVWFYNYFTTKISYNFV